MLVLSRKINESITLMLGEQIVTIHVTEFRGANVRIGVNAPKSIKVLRSELVDAETLDAVREASRASQSQSGQTLDTQQLSSVEESKDAHCKGCKKGCNEVLCGDRELKRA